MLQNTLIAQTGTVTNTSLSRTLLDGASFYGISAFDLGRFRFAFRGVNSEGLIFPYGQGVPDWGNFEISDGVKGIAYEDQWDLTGASSPTTYSVVSGALPDGLALESVSGNTGRLYGTPTVVNTFVFTLRATNSYGSDDKEFTVIISNIPSSFSGGSYTSIA